MVMVMVVMVLAAMESVVPDPTPRTSGWGRPPPEQRQNPHVVAIAQREEIRKTGGKIALPSSAG